MTIIPGETFSNINCIKALMDSHQGYYIKVGPYQVKKLGQNVTRKTWEMWE